MLLRFAKELHRIVWPEMLNETHQEILRHVGGDEVRHRKLCLFPCEDLCPCVGKGILLLKKIRIHRKDDGIHPKPCPIRLFILEKIQRRIRARRGIGRKLSILFHPHQDILTGDHHIRCLFFR